MTDGHTFGGSSPLTLFAGGTRPLAGELFTHLFPVRLSCRREGSSHFCWSFCFRNRHFSANYTCLLIKARAKLQCCCGHASIISSNGRYPGYSHAAEGETVTERFNNFSQIIHLEGGRVSFFKTRCLSPIPGAWSWTPSLQVSPAHLDLVGQASCPRGK